MSSPQACLFTATILKEGTTVERGPSDFGSDQLVLEQGHVDQSNERWHLEYACAKYSYCVLHATPPNTCGENFRGTAQIRESFLPRKFPAIRYIKVGLPGEILVYGDAQITVLLAALYQVVQIPAASKPH